MTVTLAFKAFARPIPCLTPFLATSDPSVLKRILAYIRELPWLSNIVPKRVLPIVPSSPNSKPRQRRQQRIERGVRRLPPLKSVRSKLQKQRRRLAPWALVDDDAAQNRSRQPSRASC